MKVKSYLFYIGFWSIFFLPYIGNTQFRVDQFAGLLALFVASASIAHSPMKDISKNMYVYAIWSGLILIWAMVATFASPGTMILGLKFVNTFSYFAEGVAIYLLFRYRLNDETEIFFDVMLFFSLIVNVIAYMMWSDNTGPVALKILDLYGGLQDKTNYAFGSIAGDSLAAGRISSIFPHSQALATFNLLVYAIAYSVVDTAPSYTRKAFSFVALMAAILGGLLTASKTFFLGFAIMFMLQIITGLFYFTRRPRISPAFFLTAGTFVGAAAFIFQYSRFIRDHIALFTDGSFVKILEARLGENGYLVTSSTVKVMWQPVNFIFGMGRVVDTYAWSDNGFIQIITFGGIFFFFFFYAYIFNIMYTFIKCQSSIFQRMVFFFFIAEFFANAGTLIYLFPRTSLITTVVICVVLSMGERDLSAKEQQNVPA